MCRGMAEVIATLQEAVSKASLEAAKEEAVDEVVGDSEALEEAEVEDFVREAATQGIASCILNALLLACKPLFTFSMANQVHCYRLSITSLKICRNLVQCHA
jgi:hypothetical protein